MYCKKCGAGLPSHGFVCKSCGMMMDSDQIKEQKEHIRNEENKKIELNFMSDKYSREPIIRDYKKIKENKYLGAVLIVLVVIILIVLAILKVM